ncbi:hypothetical protein N7534_008281 [Penicillium rubens]|nr:hypothetical protein N7524_003920 [Penicillium chrysogenum]KAJ5848963.1 hypothetical protein N7534_008281 [Penicillium rubens]
MASTSHSGVNHGAQVGINYGTFTALFHLPPEPPETPPSPLSTVPFTRGPDFVRRETLLDQIYGKNSVAGSRIALIGLGGVGKSQLAIEYSYQVRSKSPTTWVFWVHASNEARFEQSFRDIADQVKIPGRQAICLAFSIGLLGCIFTARFCGAREKRPWRHLATEKIVTSKVVLSLGN